MKFSIENPGINKFQIINVFANARKKEENEGLDSAEIQLLAKTLIATFKSIGGEYNENVNATYNKIKASHEKYLIRKENPYNVLEAMIKQKDIELNPTTNKGERYANSLVWGYSDGAERLSPAFMEGKASLPGGIAFIVIYKLNSDLNIIDDPNKGHHKSLSDRTNVKSTKGTLKADSIKHIIFRCPVQNFPEEMLTEQEEDILDDYLDNLEKTGRKQTKQIFRGFDFK